MTTDKIPSKSEIAKWWYDYLYQERKLKGPEAIEKYPLELAYMDIGEPDCWACGRHNSKFSDIQEYLDTKNIDEEKYTKDPDKYLWKMWNEVSLDRHHIVPKSRGGLDTPDNFALLCDLCHQEAPHTTDTDYFWAWAKGKKKQKFEKYLSAVKEAAQLAGFDFEKDIDTIAETFLILKNREHKLHRELVSDVGSILTFHGYGDPVAYFRDEIYCALKIVKEKELSQRSQ